MQYCAQPEYLFLNVRSEGLRPLLLALIYRPPKVGHLANFFSDFERLHPSFPAALIIGDFNIDLNKNSYDTDSLLDFCSANYLYLVPFSPTFHTESSHSRINHCLVSDRTLVSAYGQAPLAFLSAHDLIKVVTVPRKDTVPRPRTAECPGSGREGRPIRDRGDKGRLAPA